MDYGRHDRLVESDCPDATAVVALAIRAISVIASRAKNPSRSKDERVEDLCRAVIHADDSNRHAVVAQMLASGISSLDVVDVYVPLVARKLGEAWVDDTLSFSQVTVGAARLQELVRSFGRDAGSSVTVPLGHRVLMVIPSEEDHTLGAFVAANQFRRYGLWVHLAIGQTPDEVAETVASQSFEMIGISGAGLKALDSVRRLVTAVKLNCPRCAPVVVGGNVCNVDQHVLDFTGADFVTTSPRQAMGFCGLNGGADRVTAAEGVGYLT